MADPTSASIDIAAGPEITTVISDFEHAPFARCGVVDLPMIGLFKRKAEKTIIDGALKNLKKRVEG